MYIVGYNIILPISMLFRAVKWYKMAHININKELKQISTYFQRSNMIHGQKRAMTLTNIF